MFVAWMSWYNYFSGDPFYAYMETMVHCPIPVPDEEGKCPVGSVVLNVTACEPVPHEDSDWSLSDRCFDKANVLSVTAKLNGLNQFLGAGLSLLSVFVGGVVADAVGRKPIFLSFLAVNVLVKALLFSSCFMSWRNFEIVLFVQNIFMLMSLSPVFPAMNAMAADLSKGNEALRGDCYSAIEIVNHMADVLAFTCGYPVLRMHLGDYSYWWGLLTCVSFGALLFFMGVLKETRTDTAFSSTSGRCVETVCTEAAGSFNAVLKDPFLRQLFLVWAVVSVGVNSTWGQAQMWLQSSLHMGQANASIARALWHVTLTIGSALASPAIRRAGAQRTMILALCLFALGFGLCGFGGLFPKAAPVLFWGCALGIGGLAFGMMTPTFNTLVSVRVTEDMQAKTFASVIIINTFIGMPLGLLWPFYFFDPKATGWRIGLMWFVSAAIGVVTALYFTLICRRYGDASPMKDPSSEEESGDTSGTEGETETEAEGTHE